MRPPCEYVVKTYLPQVRARIVRNLVEEHGWKTSEVAHVLQITVTSALKYKRILNEKTEISEDVLERVAREATELILSKKATPEKFIELICRNCMVHRIGGDICKMHRAMLPNLETCQACAHVFNMLTGETNERIEVIANIKNAFLMLQQIENFDKLIPQVRTNIVMATPEAKSVEDVAGFPGRLTTLKGKLFAAVTPEFNASKHLASTLLKAKQIDSKIKSVICIKYSEEILSAIQKLKLKKIIFDREKFSNLDEFILTLNEIPDVIIDKGAVGVEPIIYVFGENAMNAAEKILKIYEQLEKGGDNYVC
ncbi:MAG: thiamine-phosphate synthase family protein [Candidatus Njordarchaeia archaeon]